MDLIVTGISYLGGWLLGLSGSVAAIVVAEDVYRQADRICQSCLRKAAKRLASFDQESRLAEWLYHLSTLETVTGKYRHAIGCYLAAGGMRRAAKRVCISFDMTVCGVGTVPLRFTLAPMPVIRLALAAGISNTAIVRRVALFTTIGYFLVVTVVVAYRTLGSAGCSRFAEELKTRDPDKWKFGVRIDGNNHHLDFSRFATVYITRPDRRPALRQLFKETVAKLGIQVQ